MRTRRRISATQSKVAKFHEERAGTLGEKGLEEEDLTAYVLKLGFRNELLQEQASKLKRALEFVVQQNELFKGHEEEEKEKKEQEQCEGGVSADEEGVDMSDEA